MTKLHLRSLTAALPLSALLLFPVLLEGQIVRGRLLDDGSGDPIPAANVALLSGTSGGGILRRTLTDSVGRFSLEASGDGRFRLRGERIGYRDVTSPPFDLVSPDTLEVELRMAVEAVLLAPLTVVSNRQALVLSQRLETGGFMERRETYGEEGVGFGRFLVRSDWEDKTPHRVVDIVREVPGVRIMGGRNIRLRSVTSLGEPWGCIPMYYLDGHILRLERDESIEEYVSPLEITAIEVYPGLSKPAQFMDMGGKACGAIVIWTG